MDLSLPQGAHLNFLLHSPHLTPFHPCSTLYVWVAVIPLGSYDEIAWEKKKARSPEGGSRLPSLSARKEGSEAGNWPDMVQFGKNFHVRRRERGRSSPSSISPQSQNREGETSTQESSCSLQSLKQPSFSYLKSSGERRVSLIWPLSGTPTPLPALTFSPHLSRSSTGGLVKSA